MKFEITINNKNYLVRGNASILQACEEVGIYVPRFCYHEKLSVAGNCRICLVEVEKSPKPVVSCAMPVSKGMVIFTDTPLVKKVREAVLEFLLINHPLDCPICDQGGECDLQDETLQYGSDRSRYFEFKRSIEDKEVGPIIKTIMTRCIHCTRCVRFSAEVSGQEVLGSFGRGEETEIGTYIQEFIKTELSGNLADICPVGALTSKPYAYKTRSWELQKVETIDFFDSTCTDIVIQTRQASKEEIKDKTIKLPTVTREEVVRVLPRNNGLFSDNWISDKTRYAFDSLRRQRIIDGLINDKNLGLKKVSIGDIVLELAEMLNPNIYNYFNVKGYNNKALNIGLVVESLTDFEGAFVLSEALKFYGSSNIQVGNIRSKINFDLPSFYTLNRSISNLSDLTALLLIGTNTRFESSLLNTNLRKQQQSKDLNYFTVGLYHPLKLKDLHMGITPKILINLIENKTAVTKSLVLTKGTSLFVGTESFKGVNGSILQNLSRFLAEKLFCKTLKGERLGILQNNTTNLIFNTLGISAGVRSNFNLEVINNKDLNMLFIVQPYELNTTKWISKNTKVINFATHKTQNVNFDMFVPIKTFYEKNGYLINLEGRIRKFYKGLTSPSKITSLDTFFSGLLRAQVLPTKWITMLSRFWRFKEETSLTKNVERINVFLTVNLNKHMEPGMFIRHVPFVKPIHDFYFTDLLTANSMVMLESSLFLKRGRNFSSI